MYLPLNKPISFIANCKQDLGKIYEVILNSMAGVISLTDFVKDIHEILQHSQNIHDSWTLVSQNADLAHQFLLKKTQKLYPVGTLCNAASAGSDGSVSDDEQSVSGQSCDMQLLYCEYHIVYSLSYSVPVMYFNIWGMNGKILSLEDVWTLLGKKLGVSHENWSFVTQQEHSILGKPFYHLHPCHTAEFMEKFQGTALKNYVACWLSIVGPAVGLDVELSYASLTNCATNN